MSARSRYHAALFARHPTVGTTPAAEAMDAELSVRDAAVRAAVVSLESGAEYWSIGAQDGMRLLRLLLDEATDAPSIKTQVQ